MTSPATRTLTVAACLATGLGLAASPVAAAPVAASSAPAVTVAAPTTALTGTLSPRRATTRTASVPVGMLAAVLEFDGSCHRLTAAVWQGRRLVARGSGASGLALSGAVARGRVRISVGAPGCSGTWNLRLTTTSRVRTPRLSDVGLFRTSASATSVRLGASRTATVRVPAGAVTAVATASTSCRPATVSLLQGRRVLARGTGRTGLALGATARSAKLTVQVLGGGCRHGWTVTLRTPAQSTPALYTTTAAPRLYAQADSATAVVSGINVYRATNAMVVYTRTTRQTVTPTNRWGLEATVVGGKVIAVNDRQLTNAAATAIPAGGFVLSGHGTSRTWLLTNARLATAVVVNAPSTPPTPTPTPTPPTPTPTPTTPAPTTTTTTPAPTTTTPAPTTTTTPAPTTTTTPAPTPTTTAPAPTTTTGTWLSGASGNGAANGAFGTWRGTPVRIGGTWNDSLDAQTAQWSIQPGGEWGTWTGDLDLAVGAIYSANGETWAKAAAGAYDARWTTALNSIKKHWGARTGTLHIRFAHEFNGSWVPWAVTGATAPDFVTAWKRFRVLQQQILPQHKLVFCPNDGTSASQSLDWRKAFPGAAYVDEMAVDSYNQYPFATTAAQFATKILAVDSYGAPVGIEKHRQFAASVGRPLAIAEWSSNSGMGDSAAFVQAFYAWVAKNAGTGAGQVPYEVMFNVVNYSNGVFSFYPTTSQPAAAAAYVTTF